MSAKMKVEIWSDIMCPFCYIGKRKYEQALAKFEHAEEVELVWKSFQLAPDLVTDVSMSNYAYLTKHKGVSITEAKQMVDHVVQRAKEEGLEYQMDKAIMGNTFKAHCLSHLAQKHGVQDKVEETLFRVC
jgi:predicted DsbA family dithiol-disulfide isomerase